MKELVTGHPYTTETVLQAEADEFIILACDGVRFCLFGCLLLRCVLTASFLFTALGCLLGSGSSRPRPQHPRPPGRE